MRGPYKVTKILPKDRYKIQLLAGAYGKTSQAAATYMVLRKGEWTPETCAVFFKVLVVLVVVFAYIPLVC